MYLKKLEIGSRFHFDVLKDFEDKVRWYWKGESKEVLEKLFQPQVMKVVEEIKNSEVESFTIFKDNLPLGVISYRIDHSGNINLFFFHLHRKFWEQHLESDALYRAIKTLKTDLKIQRICVNLIPFCRFTADVELLRNLGFQVGEWFWLKKDIKNCASASQSITDYDLIPGDDRYLSDIIDLDNEAKVLVEDLGICRSENFDWTSSIVCVRDNKTCGFNLVRCFDNFAVIEYVFVSELHRRIGIGRALISMALSRLKDKGIRCAVAEVRFDNASANALFQGMGFSSFAQSNLIGNYLPNHRS